jgi:hypothetical protein
MIYRDSDATTGHENRFKPLSDFTGVETAQAERCLTTVAVRPKMTYVLEYSDWKMASDNNGMCRHKDSDPQAT